MSVMSVGGGQFQCGWVSLLPTDIADTSSHHKIDMKSYLDTLKRESSRQQAEAIRLQQRCEKPSWEPLEVQIQRWWANLPDSMKTRPFQLAEIAGACRGRYQDRPALRCVAAALRSIGWGEYRCWKKPGRNRRFWLPTSVEVHAQPKTTDG